MIYAPFQPSWRPRPIDTDYATPYLYVTQLDLADCSKLTCNAGLDDDKEESGRVAQRELGDKESKISDLSECHWSH